MYNYLISLFVVCNFCYLFGRNDFDSLHVGPKETQNLLLFKSLYKKNKNIKPSSKNLIPKRIHQIWIGPKPLPEKFKWMMQTIKKNHSAWQYKLWTNKDLKKFKLKNQKVFDCVTNIGAKADILRYEILERFGGVYFDIDFESLKPLDIYNKTYSFYAGLLYETDIVANGFIACGPNHPILKECVKRISEIKQCEGNFDFILGLTGPYFFTDVISKYLYNVKNHKRIIILPSNYFFPFPAGQRFQFWNNYLNRQDVLNYVKPETLGIHYWATSWQN